MSAIILSLMLTAGTAEAGITVTPMYKTPGHSHSSHCSHRPHPRAGGKWVWVPGKIYKYVRFGRVKYHQEQGHWKFVPHAKKK